MSGTKAAENGLAPIPDADRRLLRDLGRRVAEIGNRPDQAEKAERWRRHNDLQPGRPMVLIFPEGAWREMPRPLSATHPLARQVENDLRTRLYYDEHLRDDNVIEPVVYVGPVLDETGWGFEAHRVRTEDPLGAAHYEPVIREESDLDKLKISRIRVDAEATRRRQEILAEVFEGVLPVELRVGAYTGVAMMDLFAQWRGFDQLFLDLVERPEWVHQAMARLLEGAVARHEDLLKSGLTTLNNRNHYTGSGGTGYTRQLPAPGFDGVRVRSCDLWGFATTQIFSEVSPDMHEEFALQYERPFLARFGLNAYGCCEPLHRKLDQVLTIPNIRRISVSPWADVRMCAERLGNRYVFSYKPNPAVMAAERWDPESVRRGLREMLELTRGCVVEIIMKDTHTCRQQPERMWEWVRLAKEEAARLG
jgi:hypothetical protein